MTAGQSFQQGMQSREAGGKQAQQAVVNAAADVARAGKQVVVKLGNIVITVVTYGAAVIWLIGKGIYKVTATIGGALLKLISSTGKAVVGGATALGNATIAGLKSAGILIDKGAKWVGQQLTSLKDSSLSVAKWLLNSAKQLGTKAWAKILAGASAISGIGQQLGGWLKSQWDTISNQVGVKWDQAKSMATGALKNAGQAISNTANDIKKGASNLVNKAANYTGQAAGWLKGFLSELFNRFVSFKGDDMISILSEAKQYNGKSIVL
jgi:hypothetical protein